MCVPKGFRKGGGMGGEEGGERKGGRGRGGEEGGERKRGGGRVGGKEGRINEFFMQRQRAGDLLPPSKIKNTFC
jgi:hypothetical protein